MLRPAEEFRQLIRELHAVPAFAAAAPSQLEALLKGSALTVVKARARLGSAGDPASFVQVLLEGAVRIFHEEQPGGVPGREVTVKHLSAPCTFSEKEVLAREPLVECTETLVRSRVLKIRADAFLAFLGPTDLPARRILEDVCRRFCVAIRNERSLLAPVPARLASLLVAHLEWFGRETERGVVLRLPLTQQDLADGLAVGLRSISRTLSTWSRRGIVSREKGWVIVRKPAVLIELCGDLRFNLNYGGLGR
ncbi:MAG: Crp/Fnr family transcriptional regulator [Myxococcaceae bacterium]